MILGLDTSVVIRLLTGQPPEMAAAASTRLEQAVLAGDRIVITDLVVAEAYFVLVHHYGLTKQAARSALRTMAISGVVELQPTSAMAALAPSATAAGFVDHLIISRHRGLNALTLTFDAKMGRESGVETLSSTA